MNHDDISGHETEEGKSVREKNELDLVGNYKSDSGISVDDVLEVVDMRTLKSRNPIAHNFNTWWDVGTLGLLLKKMKYSE